MNLDDAIQIADLFLEPRGEAGIRAPTFSERACLRRIVRAAKTSREQLKVLKMAVDNTANMVEQA
jgi:hypothetical protein